MGRAIGGVVVAFVLWTVLWLGFNAIAQSMFPQIIDPTQPLTHVGALVVFILYSALISIAAGFVCAAVKKEAPMKTVLVFAVIQLAIGIFVQTSYWDLMPIWYHLSFLGLIVPATLWGGRLKAEGSAAAA